VSFTDDFTKFTWVYYLHAKSDVESIFLRFQKHVELLLDAKIKSVQSDWGVNIVVSTNIFLIMASCTTYPAPTPTSRTVQLNESIGTLSKPVFPF
jgi:hypothetical protein